MPRIKRWFPVSHDINADPEVWAMRHRIGEKSLSVWLEFLSISDRNEGQLPGDFEELIRLVSGRCQATKRTVRAVYDFALTRLWLTSDPCLKVCNYEKYHRIREPQKPLLGSLPSEPSEPSEPSLPKETKAKKAATPNGFAEFYNLYPKKKHKGDAEKAWKSLNPSSELLVKILNGVRRARGAPDWLKQNGQFIPYPATWLRARGWEDEGVTFNLVTVRNGDAKPKAVQPPPKPEDIERSKEFLRATITKLSGKMGI